MVEKIKDTNTVEDSFNVEIIKICFNVVVA